MREEIYQDCLNFVTSQRPQYVKFAPTVLSALINLATASLYFSHFVIVWQAR